MPIFHRCCFRARGYDVWDAVNEREGGGGIGVEVLDFGGIVGRWVCGIGKGDGKGKGVVMVGK